VLLKIRLTTQYFLWYLIFFPVYLPATRLSSRPLLAVSAVAAWVVGQAYWLYEGYRLEFLGEQTYVPGLWRAGLIFFGINCWILGLVIDDVSGAREPLAMAEKT
jgi:phosphatidylinositol glycan class M